MVGEKSLSLTLADRVVSPKGDPWREEDITEGVERCLEVDQLLEEVEGVERCLEVEWLLECHLSSLPWILS
jgi:hypothetical protein